MTRAAIYARVSSKGQRDKHTIEGQLRVLPAFVAQQGWSLVGTYTDDGRTAKSGHLDARDGFARLLADVAAGKIDILAVVDIDRLTRTDDMIERASILGPLQRAGVRIVTPSGGELDLRSFFGEFYASMQAIVAAEENRKRKERTISGKAVAISRGRKPAGPTPYGLRYDRHAEVEPWTIDPDEASLIREMHRRVQRGESCETIALDLNSRGIRRPRGGDWIRERVWAIVRSRTYIGEWTADKEKGAVLRVPPIIDVATYERTQAQLAAQGRRGLKRTKRVYLLEDLAVCERCGTRIGICSASSAALIRISDSPARYVCAHRRRPPYGSPRCLLGYQKTADADDRMWAAVVATLQRRDLIEDALENSDEADADRSTWERDLAEHLRRLARLDSSEAGALARHRRGQVSAAALDMELAAVSRERKMLKRQVETAERAIGSAAVAGVRADDVAEAIAAARSMLTAATPAARRHLMLALFQPGDIVIGEPTITATLRLALAERSGRGHVRQGSRKLPHEASVMIRLVA